MSTSPTPHCAVEPGSAAADRPDTLEGAPNFRSVSSLPAADGRSIRPYRLFRSDALHRLSESDLQRLEALRIRTVLDLRRDDERQSAPTRWPSAAPASTRLFDASPELEVVQAGGWRTVIRQEDFHAPQARAWMAQTYARMPIALAPAVRDAIELLSRPVPTGESGDAVLVHCTAGKDRTGFVCAMVLSALDVPHEAILEDYLESSRRRPPETLARTLLEFHGIEASPRAVSALEAIAGVNSDFLDSALSAIDEKFGSRKAYLQQACGLDSQRLEAFRVAMLD